jgi:SPP1 family phage portal protein
MFTISKGEKITKDLIKQVVDYNEKQVKDLYRPLEDYYTGEHPILKRAKEAHFKNNKLVINHARYITTIKSGYLLGKPITYSAPEKYNLEPIMQEYKEQNIKRLDKTIDEDRSKFGKAFDFTYADEENNVRTKRLLPFNCIVVYDDTVEHNEVFAIVYSARVLNKTEYEYIDLKVITDQMIVSYSKTLDSVIDTKLHSFGELPIVEYKNNDDSMGDYFPVVSLIDAYNLLESDRVNDKEQLVDAIMVLYGVTLTAEQLRDLQNQRTMSVNSKSEGTDVEYLVKNLDEAQADVLRKRIEDDIFKISMTPNMTDENFIGNSSGVALKYKLLPFEISTNAREIEFEHGLRKRMRLYNTYLNRLSGMPLVPSYEIDVEFHKSLPQNDFEMSQTLLNLSDLIDKRTALEQISFVEDPEKVLEAKELEKEVLDDNYGTEFASNGVSEIGKMGEGKVQQESETLLKKISNVLNGK